MRSKLLGLLLLAGPNLVDAQGLYNPKPLDDDYSLPVPGDAEMVFRIVQVPGKGFWSDPSRLIQIGDAGGGPFEGLQRIQINGSFPDASGEGWHYYLAKYELTKGQFISVAGMDRFLELSGDPADQKLPSLGGDELKRALAMPVAYLSYSAIQAFIQSYNQWLFDPAEPTRVAALPTIEGVPGFVRLPTEQEWEYAARGGQVAVADGTFDQRLPFSPRKLKAYAWTLKNAKHKVRPIGLRKPNPLGFHGLYGNVQEIVSGTFQPELVQGKPGGVPVRGASVSSPDRDVRSANRGEFDAWAWNPDSQRMEERRAFNTGTRLAIGSNVVVSSQYQRRIQKEYVDYKQVSRKNTPVGRSLDNAMAQATAQLGTVDPIIKRIKADYPDLQEEIGQLEHYVGQARIKLDLAQREGARSVAQDALRNGVNLSGYLSRLAKMTQAREAAKKLAEISTRYQEQADAIDQNMRNLQTGADEQFVAYGEKLASLGGYDETYYSEALRTLGKKALLAREAQVLELLTNHVEAFSSQRRINNEGWRKEFEDVFGSFVD